MTKHILSNKVFDNLLKQLVTLEEGREILESYKGNEKAQLELASTIMLYKSKLVELVETAGRGDLEDTSVPTVVVGAEPTVCDMDSGERITYRITTPETFETEGNDVTLHSPIGKALFLKEVGDKVDIKVPAGTIRYVIESVELNSDIELKSLFKNFE